MNATRDDLGLTPLKAVCWAEKPSPEVMRLLLAKGARPNEESGRGPLWGCASRGELELVKILVEAGALPTEEDLGISQSQGHGDVHAYLLEAWKRAPERVNLYYPQKASVVDRPSYFRMPRPKDAALVVAGEGPYAARDAETVRKHMVALGLSEERVRLVQLEEGGESVISAVKRWLPSRAGPGATAFFYYAGPSETLPAARLFEELEQLRAERVVAFLEAPAPAAKPGRKVTALAAAAAGQPPQASETERHGLFTFFLLKGLAEGKRSAKALHAYLAPLVEGQAGRQRSEQTPVMLGEDAPL